MPRIGEFMGPSPFRDRAPRPTASERLAHGLHTCAGAVMHLAEITVAAVHHTPNQALEPSTAVTVEVQQAAVLQEAA